MNHRHLLPNEIDLLVDGEVGFGVAPLLAHVRECDQCRHDVEEGRQIAAMLEELPRFAPSWGLADRVMAEVPVYVPWHVAARDAVLAWVPQSRPVRVLALAGTSVMAMLITLGTLWILTRGGLVGFMGAAAGDQVRTAFNAGGRQIASLVFGDHVLVAVSQSGVPALAIAAAGFLAAAVMALAGLRAAAAASRRRS